jgi:hypothetical protein
MSYFNNKGELNASSVKEALAQIAKFASVLEDNSPSDLGMNAVAARNDDELVSRALNTSEGKLALASSMANPIRKNLDYHGIARRALVVEALAQGAIASYERDIDVAACVVSSNGGGAESRVFGERITVPEYELFSNPTVRWKEVKSRRFNVIDRAIQKASQEIQAQEDANVFAALDAASSLENTVQDLADSGVMKRDLINMKRQVDHWDLVTAKYFMNINEFTDLLQWGSGGGQGVGGGDLDPVSMREVLQTGLYAHLFGADILVSKIVPAGTIYCCADPEFVGVMPIRQDIEIMPADEPKQMKLGWVVSCIEGCAIVNTRGVAAGRKSTLAQ